MISCYLAVALVGYAFIPLVQADCNPDFDPNCVSSNFGGPARGIVIACVVIFVFFTIFAILFSRFRYKRIRQANLTYIRNAQTARYPPVQPSYLPPYGGGPDADTMKYPLSDAPPINTDPWLRPPPPSYSPA